MPQDNLKNALAALAREGLTPEGSQAMADTALVRRVPNLGKRRLKALRDAYPQRSQTADDALREILKVTMDHPLFRRDLYDSRDFAALDHVGGDEATFAYIAILAAQGLGLLRAEDQLSKTHMEKSIIIAALKSIAMQVNPSTGIALTIIGPSPRQLREMERCGLISCDAKRADRNVRILEQGNVMLESIL